MNKFKIDKKMMLFALLVLILCISAVSAANDDNSTDSLTESADGAVVINDNVLTTADSAKDFCDNSTVELDKSSSNGPEGFQITDKNILSSSQDSEILTAGEGTFTDLRSLISSAAADTTITLDKDYIFNPDTDMGTTSANSMANGILIDKKITINGNGHTVKYPLRSDDWNATGIGGRVFRITAASVSLTNIRIENGWNNYDEVAADYPYRGLLSGQYGMGIWCTAAGLNLDGVTFYNNRQYTNSTTHLFGAQLYVCPSKNYVNGLTVNNCIFTVPHETDTSITDTGFAGSAIFAQAVNVVISNCEFSHMGTYWKVPNYSRAALVYLYSTGQVSLTGCTFNYNGDGNYNRIVYFRGGTPTASDNVDDASFTALQNLINSASAGSTIKLEHDYIFNEAADADTLRKGIVINKKLTIEGNGHVVKYPQNGDNNVANNNGIGGRIFDITSNDVTLSNMTLRHAYINHDVNVNYATNIHGGAIKCSGSNLVLDSIYVSNCILTSNVAGERYNGAALYMTGASNLKIINCIFEGGSQGVRSTGHQGGLVYAKTTNIDLINTTIQNACTYQTSSSGVGLVIFFENTGTFSNINVENNTFYNIRGTQVQDILYIKQTTGNIRIYNNFANYTSIDDRLFGFNGAGNPDTPLYINITGNRCTQVISDESGAFAVFNSNYYSHIEISNNNLTNCRAKYSIMNIYNKNTVSDIVIKDNNLKIVGSTQSGQDGGLFRFYTNANIYFYNNTINDTYATARASCILIAGVNNVGQNIFIENNTFENFYLRSGATTTVMGMAIKCENNGYPDINVTIRNNTFDYGRVYHPTNNNSIASTISGIIYVGPLYQGTVIEQNIFKNLNLTAAVYGGGGVIYNEGNDTVIRNNTFININSSSVSGGFVYNSGNNVSISDNVLSNNVAIDGGAIYNTGNNVTIVRNTFINNTALNTAGVIYNTGENITIYNNTITNNSATDAGAFYITGKNVDVYDNIFTDNHASNYYAVLYVDAVNSTLYTNKFIDNTAASHGVIALGNGVNLYDSNFTSNVVVGLAGVLYIFGDDNNITNLLIDSATAHSHGGTVYNIGDNNILTNIDLGLTESASGFGGFAYSEGDNFTLSNIKFESSSAYLDGGFIYSRGKFLNISDINVKSSKSITGSGGVIYNVGDNLTVYSVKISDSQAGRDGGAIYNVGNYLIVYNLNSTNTNAGGSGGVIYNVGDNLTAYDLNISASHAGVDGGAVYSTGSSSSIYNINFTNTDAGHSAGAVYMSGDNSTVHDLSFDKVSSAYDAGALMYNGATGTIYNLNISDVNAGHDGGALFVSGSNIEMNYINFTDVHAGHDGGAIYCTASDSKLYNISIVNVYADNNAGSIYWSGDNADLYNITIDNSSSKANGGVLYMSGHNSNLSHSTFTKTDAVNGGCLYWIGDHGTLYDTTFSDIKSANTGGAIYWLGNIANFTDLSFINIASGGEGGAIYGSGTSSNFENIDFEEITSGGNGGAFYWSGGLSYYNNLMFLNTFSGANGGALYVTGEKSHIKNSNFTNTSCAINGGGCYWSGIESSMTNISYINCTADEMAGGCYWSGSYSNMTYIDFINCTAIEMGGGLFWFSSNGVLNNSIFDNNTAKNGGAIYWIGNNAAINDINLTNNEAEVKGGAVYIISSNGLLHDLIFINNTCEVDGGAVTFDGYDSKIYNSQFINNTARSNGGAVDWIGYNGTLYNNNFTNNEAGIGGAVYWTADYGNISKVTFINNNASSLGGSVYMSGLTGGELTDCTFENSTANSGGAVYWICNDGLLSDSSFYNASASEGGAIYWSGSNGLLTDLLFDQVSAENNGGVLYISNSYVEVLDSNFYNSHAANGGAIYWVGLDGKLSNANFVNNSATISGGGIYWIGNNANITSVNFTNNSADIDGGALYIVSYGATLSKLDFVNNTAANYGGAIYWSGNGKIMDSSLTYNRAYSGSAVYNAGTLQLGNTVILNNKADVMNIVSEYEENNAEMIITIVLKGRDNFLNGIWTTSDNIYINKVTYWGYENDEGSVIVSEENWISPQSGAERDVLYYDTRVAGINVTGSIRNRTTGEEKLKFSGVTNIFGTYVYRATKLINSSYILTVIHEEDDYYTYVNSSKTVDIGITKPDVILKLIKDQMVWSEFSYGSNVTIDLTVSASDNGVPLSNVTGKVRIYIDGNETDIVIGIKDGRAVYSTGLPSWVGVGDHNMTGLFFDGTCIDGTIPLQEVNSTDPFNFTLTKNREKNNIVILYNSTNVHVGDLINITIQGPAAYTGIIRYVTGHAAGTINYNQRVDGAYNITTQYNEEGRMDILIYGEEDDNYMPFFGQNHTTVTKKTISINFTEDSYTINVGEDAVPVVNLNATDVTGNVIIKINGKEYAAVIKNGVATVAIPSLTNGTYTLTATYGGDNRYLAAENDVATVYVNKIPTNVSISTNDINYGEKLNITVNIDDGVEGSITLKINDTYEKTISILDGKVEWIVDGLASDNYTIYAIYNGNEMYSINDTVSRNVAVNRISPNIKIISVDCEADKPAVIVVEIDPRTDNNIIVNVNGHDYSNTTIDGKVVIVTDELGYNTYTVNASYAGDKNFTKDEHIVSFTTNKTSDYDLSIIANDIEVEKLTNITVNVPLDATGIVILNIDGVNYTANIDGGKAVFEKQTNLGVGKYNATAYFGNIKYENKTVTGVFYISMHDTPITISVDDIKVGEDAVINVTVPKGVSENVTIEIDGVKYNKTVNAQGKAVFTVPSLSNGTKTIVASYGGDAKYAANSTSAVLNVIRDVPVVDADDIEFVVDGSDVLNITGPADGNLIVTINGVDYSVTYCLY